MFLGFKVRFMPLCEGWRLGDLVQLSLRYVSCPISKENLSGKSFPVSGNKVEDVAISIVNSIAKYILRTTETEVLKFWATL